MPARTLYHLDQRGPAGTLMNPERVHQIREWCEASVQLAPDARAAFLDQQCGADTDAREFVARMLAADSREAAPLDSPVLERPPDPRREGQRVGPYRILREIGNGGTASVYLAIREPETGTPVAVKILHWRAL